MSTTTKHTKECPKKDEKPTEKGKCDKCGHDLDATEECKTRNKVNQEILIT